MPKIIINMKNKARALRFKRHLEKEHPLTRGMIETDFGFGVKIVRGTKRSKIAGGKILRFKIKNTQLKKNKRR